MPTYQSYQLLNQLQEQTEQFLTQAISEWQMTKASTLLRRPGENQWSAAQCLEHLNSYGRYYLPQIEAAIESAKRSGLEATEEFKTAFLGNYFTQMMLPKEGNQKKMNSPKDHQPVADLDADKVVREFIDQQETLISLLEKARKINLNKARVPISIARFIKLKLGDVFMFVIAHNHRHVLQAERAIAAPALKGEERSASIA
jgi:AraC-like DNA-binding protein